MDAENLKWATNHDLEASMLEIKRFSFRIEPDFAPVWTMGDILDSLKNTQREHIHLLLVFVKIIKKVAC